MGSDRTGTIGSMRGPRSVPLAVLTPAVAALAISVGCASTASDFRSDSLRPDQAALAEKLDVILAAAIPAPAPQEPPPVPTSSFDQPEPDPDPRVRPIAPALPPPPPLDRPPSVLRIKASEPEAELSVTAEAPGWRGSCSALVSVDRPCHISPVPAGQMIDLRITGARSFASKVLLAEGSTTVVITHRGYGETVAGLVAMGIALVVLRAGVSVAEGGNGSAARALISAGVGIEALGVLMILTDLGSTHNRAVVVN